MVKSKQALKKPQPPAAKRPKTTHKPAASARTAVDPTKLAWSTVHLPSEAQSGGAGQTESDFFSSLNWDDDDFMGLQEIDDVDIVQEARPDGSRTISFLASDKKLKSKNNKPAPASSSSAPANQPETTQKKAKKPKKSKKRSIDQVASESEPEPAPEPASSSHADESVAELEDAESDAYETAADHTIADQDADSDLDDDDLAEAFRNAHNLDLHDDEDDDEFDDSSLPAWSHLPLHAALKRALAHKGFQSPTEIQNRSIPLALGLQQDASSDSDEPSTSLSAFKKRDVVGVSQTGSGKTLAYGLPILNYLFHNAENVASAPIHGDVPPPLGALILCPTRELALQVSAHLTDVIRSSCLVDDTLSYAKLVRRPQIAVVCGGMSEHKQRRLLQGRSRRAGVDIIVATPGRLWEMTRLDDELAARIKQVRFLVLDEADRMVQVGHFAEMEHILNLVHRAEAQRPKEGQDGQQSDSDGEGGAAVVGEGVRPNAAMQTFVFSATLSKALQTNLKRRRKMPQFTKKRHSKRSAAGSTLEELLERIDFRSSPAIVDLTPAQGLPSGLMETKLECVSKDKDAYLYYFLLRYPGRSLVFVNSIDGIRRLSPILAQLGLVCYPIHSQLQQKQRLKNLDRFRSAASNCILLATDVAARGLDIPSVDHVVHYQLPRSADTYIHRSGRTARAGTSGVSLALIEPREKTLWSQLSRALSRPDPPSFPITFSTLSLLRERVELAIAIDKQMHAATKQAHDDSWLAQLARDADLAVSDDDLDPDAPTSKGANNSKSAAKLAEMRARLARLLAKPVTMVGVSHRYLTATGLQGSAWVDEMLQEKAHKHFVGEKNTDAQTEIEARKPEKQQAKKAKGADAQAEIEGKQQPAKQPGKKAKKPKVKQGAK